MDDLAITWLSYGVICKETKTIPSNEKKVIWQTQNFYILLAFLLITIALLVAVSISCYLINYQEIQKHLFTFYITIDKLIKVLY